MKPMLSHDMMSCGIYVSSVLDSACSKKGLERFTNTLAPSDSRADHFKGSATIV